MTPLLMVFSVPPLIVDPRFTVPPLAVMLPAPVLVTVLLIDNVPPLLASSSPALDTAPPPFMNIVAPPILAFTVPLLSLSSNMPFWPSSARPPRWCCRRCAASGRPSSRLNQAGPFDICTVPPPCSVTALPTT